MNYPDTIKKNINDSVMSLIVEFLNTKTPFSLIVSSRNWDAPLPDKLKNMEYFIIQIQEQTMEESYYDMSTNEVYIFTEFDGVKNSITLFAEDVKGIMDISMQIPILMKPYSEEPVYSNIQKVKVLNTNPLVNFKENELTPEVKHSLDCIIKNNPNLFKGV